MILSNTSSTTSSAKTGDYPEEYLQQLKVDLSLHEHKTDLIYKKVSRDKTLNARACRELTTHIDNVFNQNIADEEFMNKVD